MPEREVILLIESDPAEAVLASAAVALRSDVEVLRAPNLRAAADMLGEAPVGLAILGRQAIGSADPTAIRGVRSAVPGLVSS